MCDERNGCEVCTDCGLVLQEKLPTFPSPSTDTCIRREEDRDHIWLRSELSDILSRICQDNSLIIEQILSFLKTHFSLMKSKLLTRNGRGMIGYAIWEILNKERNPHSMQTIAYLIGGESKEIQRAAREINISPSFCPPSAFCNKLLSELSLPFKFKAKVTKAVQMSDHLMGDPKGVIGGVLHEYYVQLSRVRKTPIPSIHVRRTASHFFLAESTILSARRKLTKECLSFIRESVNDVNVRILKMYTDI